MIEIQSGIRITSHAVGIVNVETQADGSVLVDRMEYTKKGRTSVRHCMETGENGETVSDTLASCLYEIVKDRTTLSYELVSEDPIFLEYAQDEKNPGGTHLRVWYAVRVKSALRDFNLPDGDEVLGPVTMVEVNQLLKETVGKTVRGHVSATYAALAVLAGNRRVFDRYQKLIVSWSPLEPTPDQQSAIDAYRAKW